MPESESDLKMLCACVCAGNFNSDGTNINNLILLAEFVPTGHAVIKCGL